MSDGGQDLIDEFVKICSPYIDAPKVFIEAGGYSIVSSILGPYHRSTWLPPPGRPNLWILISSIPGRMRRSSLQNYVSYVYKKVLFALKKDEVKAENEKREKGNKIKNIDRYTWRVVEDTLIEEGTPEGIADHIEGDRLKHFSSG